MKPSYKFYDDDAAARAIVVELKEVCIYSLSHHQCVKMRIGFISHSLSLHFTPR